MMTSIKEKNGKKVMKWDAKSYQKKEKRKEMPKSNRYQKVQNHIFVGVCGVGNGLIANGYSFFSFEKTDEMTTEDAHGHHYRPRFTNTNVN